MARRSTAALTGLALAASLSSCSTAAPTTAAATKSAPAAAARQADCAGFAAPRVISAPAVTLPATMTAAHVSLDMPGEVVVSRDGAPRDIHTAGAEFALLSPFAEEALKRARFLPASIQGNPVAARVSVIIPVGASRPPRPEAVPPSLRAYVPGTEPPEARWQLRDSVERLTLVGHVAKLAAPGATIVAVAPGGAERVLVTIPASTEPQEIRETVKVGKFLAGAGDYRLAIRANGVALAFTTVTIAEDYKQAVVNACETITVARKTGPGN